MSCGVRYESLQAYADGELDAVSAWQVEQHCAACAPCHGAVNGLRALSAVIRRSAPVAPPPALEERVRRAVQAEGFPRRSRARPAALVTGAVAAAALIAVWAGQPSRDLNGELVAGHVRSLMADHLTDVASSDRHTVRPWFAGKLDFVPPVRDLEAQGFPLVGARLEYVDELPAAALVYRRRKHVINLFVWRDGSASSHLVNQRGYHLETWAQDGLRHVAVSDLNAAELRQFSGLIRAAP